MNLKKGFYYHSISCQPFFFKQINRKECRTQLPLVHNVILGDNRMANISLVSCAYIHCSKSPKISFPILTWLHFPLLKCVIFVIISDCLLKDGREDTHPVSCWPFCSLLSASAKNTSGRWVWHSFRTKKICPITIIFLSVKRWFQEKFSGVKIGTEVYLFHLFEAVP